MSLHTELNVLVGGRTPRFPERRKRASVDPARHDRDEARWEHPDLRRWCGHAAADADLTEAVVAPAWDDGTDVRSITELVWLGCQVHRVAGRCTDFRWLGRFDAFFILLSCAHGVGRSRIRSRPKSWRLVAPKNCACNVEPLCYLPTLPNPKDPTNANRKPHLRRYFQALVGG